MKEEEELEVPREKAEIVEQTRQKKAIAAQELSSLSAQVSRMSHKERLLSERARRVFGQLGPNALVSMQAAAQMGGRPSSKRKRSELFPENLIDMPSPSIKPSNVKSETETDSPKTASSDSPACEADSPVAEEPEEEVKRVPAHQPDWLPKALKSVPTLRAFERFMGRVASIPGCAAYFRLVPLPAGERLVPDEVCAGDPYFHNTIGVFPSHVFASLRRMVAVHQRKYVEVNGRRVPLFGWPFPTTVCQATCFSWLMSEGILQRFRTVGAPPPVRQIVSRRASKAAKKTRGRKKLALPKKQATRTSFDLAASRMARLSAGSELYQYNFVSYVAAPPDEGASASEPTVQLPAFEATRAAVRRHYECAVAKLIYVARNRDEPISNWLDYETDAIGSTIPFLSYVPPVEEDIAAKSKKNKNPVRWICEESGWIPKAMELPAVREIGQEDGLEWWLGVVRPKKKTDVEKRVRKRPRTSSSGAPSSVPVPVSLPAPAADTLLMSAPLLFKCDVDGLPLFLFPDFKAEGNAKPRPIPTFVMQPRKDRCAVSEDRSALSRRSVLEACDESEIVPGEWNAPLLLTE